MPLRLYPQQPAAALMQLRQMFWFCCICVSIRQRAGSAFGAAAEAILLRV